MEASDLADCVLVQKLLEAHLKPRQSVGLKRPQHFAVFARRFGRRINLASLLAVLVRIVSHGESDLLPHTLNALVLGIDSRFQPVAIVALFSVTILDREAMLPESLVARHVEPREERLSILLCDGHKITRRSGS